MAKKNDPGRDDVIRLARPKKGTTPKGSTLGVVLPSTSDDTNVLWSTTSKYALIKKMRRTDPSVIAYLHAYKDPILTTTWTVLGDKQPQVDFITQNLFKRIRFNKFLEQALAYLDYGCMVFEKSWINDQGKWYLDSLGPRYPWTFTMNRAKDNLSWESISQSVGSKGTVVIPMEKLVFFVNEQEGDDLLGTSVLRQLYKPWTLKEKTEMTMDTIIQRNGMGIPVANIPDTISDTDEDSVVGQLENIAANDDAYFVEKGGMAFRFQGVDGGTVDATPFLSHLETNMMEAGAQGVYGLATANRGSSASGDTLSGLYYSRIAAIAANICDTLNHDLIPQMIDYNFGIQLDGVYPQLQSSAIAAKGFVAKAEAIAHLQAAGFLWPEPKICNWIRGSLDIPTLAPGEDVPPAPAKDPASADGSADTSKTASAKKTAKSDSTVAGNKQKGDTNAGK